MTANSTPRSAKEKTGNNGVSYKASIISTLGPERSVPVDILIERGRKAVHKACQTPQGAKDLLIRAGILTKKGTIRKKYL